LILIGLKLSKRVSNSEFNNFLAKILLLQREIPEYVNFIAAKIAREAGTMVILDVGGRDEPFTTDLLNYVDVLTPNEVFFHSSSKFIRLSS